MNFYLSNLVFQCFMQHLELCLSTINVNETFLNELVEKKIISVEEKLFLIAPAAQPVGNINYNRVILLLRLLRANLNILKFYGFLKSRADTLLQDYSYLVLRLGLEFRKFQELIELPEIV